MSAVVMSFYMEYGRRKLWLICLSVMLLGYFISISACLSLSDSGGKNVSNKLRCESNGYRGLTGILTGNI
jgi:hypothetical protein